MKLKELLPIVKATEVDICEDGKFVDKFLMSIDPENSDCLSKDLLEREVCGIGMRVRYKGAVVFKITVSKKEEENEN